MTAVFLKTARPLRNLKNCYRAKYVSHIELLKATYRVAEGYISSKATLCIKKGLPKQAFFLFRA